MTVQEIIAASIAAHPAEFRAKLIEQAEIHNTYMELCSNPQARRGAQSQFNACLAAYDLVALEDVAGICATLNTMVVALNVAAKLQGLAPSIATAAAAAWQPAR